MTLAGGVGCVLVVWACWLFSRWSANHDAERDQKAADKQMAGYMRWLDRGGK